MVDYELVLSNIPCPDWEVHTKGERSYWKIVRLGGSTPSYQFFVDLLKRFDREDLNQLWALVKETLNIRPTTIEWKLYDTCGVYHVTSNDKDIFMLVEKDYPLRKGLAIVMISYKLQVKNYSQMANDLILKIYKISNCLRHQDDWRHPLQINILFWKLDCKWSIKFRRGLLGIKCTRHSHWQ
nr:hypothetical protein [Tanacetum cinerariifolium]